MTDKELVEQVEKMKARIGLLDSNNRILIKQNENLKKEIKLLKKQLKEKQQDNSNKKSLKLFE